MVSDLHDGLRAYPLYGNQDSILRIVAIHGGGRMPVRGDRYDRRQRPAARHRDIIKGGISALICVLMHSA